MEPKDVRAFGCDYSDREYSPQELDQYPGVKISFVFRYIGYPGNPKCISHYPGAYKRHRDSGRPVGLFHQIGYRDFEGGYNTGRVHAVRALTDAENQGWQGETPIVAAFDRRMAAFSRGGVFYRAIPLDEVRSYMNGFTSVLGYEHSGFYGFEDTMGPAVAENWARFRIQCGARSAHINGIQAWQENNLQPVLFGSGTDRIELYVPLEELANKSIREELGMGDFLVRDPEDGACYIVTLSSTTQSKFHIPNTEQLGVFAELMGVDGPRNVSSFAAKYLADEPGTDDVDEAAIIAGVSAGVIPVILNAIEEIDFSGMTREQQIEAVQEALRRGTGSAATEKGK